MLTQEYLKSRLRYRPETGLFYWILLPPSKQKHLNKVAGSSHTKGYVTIGIKGRAYLAHRLAWLYVYGHFPQQMDHINQIKDDNRIENLRECTDSQNRMNSKPLRNSTGFRGVTPNKKGYGARIKINRTVHWLGTFKTPEEASTAYEEKRKELFGEFA